MVSLLNANKSLRKSFFKKVLPAVGHFYGHHHLEKKVNEKLGYWNLWEKSWTGRLRPSELV